MQLDDCFELGYIVKPHGTKGEVQVFLDVDRPEEYSEMESVFVAQGTDLIPFFISNIKKAGKSTVFELEDIDSIEQAEELRGLKLYLPLDFLPQLADHQFYYHEIVHFEIHDKHLGKLGTVKEVFLKGKQDLIVMEYKNTDVLIPVTDEIITGIDKTKKHLEVDLPQGLLDIYLS